MGFLFTQYRDLVKPINVYGHIGPVSAQIMHLGMFDVLYWSYFSEKIKSCWAEFFYKGKLNI